LSYLIHRIELSLFVNLIYIGQIADWFCSSIIAILCLRSGKDLAAGSLLIRNYHKPCYLVLALLGMVIGITGGSVSRYGYRSLHPGSSTAICGVVSSYIRLLSSFPIQGFVTTTLGGFISVEYEIKIFRFVGLLLFPLIFPLLKLIEREGWLPAINIALLVSIPLSFYGFCFDEIMLLPAIGQMVFWVVRKELPRFHLHHDLILIFCA
jgi:hypothetical protein